jgi:hypothetical protein
MTTQLKPQSTSKLPHNSDIELRRAIETLETILHTPPNTPEDSEDEEFDDMQAIWQKAG